MQWRRDQPDRHAGHAPGRSSRKTTRKVIKGCRDWLLLSGQVRMTMVRVPSRMPPGRELRPPPASSGITVSDPAAHGQPGRAGPGHDPERDRQAGRQRRLSCPRSRP